jgi:DNA-binding transcriptional regulator YbjK
VSASTNGRTNRRTAIVDAAIEILATLGGRGLTHRAVDRRLGIAEGCTSTYFRTREALLTAVAERVLVRNLALVEATPRGDASASFGQAMAALIEAATSDRTLQIARYELMLESTRREPLRESFLLSRQRFVDEARRLLEAWGLPVAEARARAVAMLMSGVLLERTIYPYTLVDRDELAADIDALAGSALPISELRL